jgi:hypothetical protein
VRSLGMTGALSEYDQLRKPGDRRQVVLEEDANA